MHCSLETDGYDGSERTTWPAVVEAEACAAIGLGQPPCLAAGTWQGAVPVGLRHGLLAEGAEDRVRFGAWFGLEQYGVALPILAKTLPTVIACIDVTLRHSEVYLINGFERQREERLRWITSRASPCAT